MDRALVFGTSNGGSIPSRRTSNSKNIVSGKPWLSRDAFREAEEENLLSPERIIFNEKRFVLLLKINKKAIDLGNLPALAEQNGFDQKDDFHITVLSSKTGNKIKEALQPLPEKTRSQKLREIKSLVRKTDWRFNVKPQRYHLSKEYVSLATKDGNEELRERRESYVQTVDLPGVKIFYESLNRLLGTDLEAPPIHITLYTSGDDREKAKAGIGINSQEEFQSLNPQLLE